MYNLKIKKLTQKKQYYIYYRHNIDQLKNINHLILLLKTNKTLAQFHTKWIDKNKHKL